jgi:hypothetical protein
MAESLGGLEVNDEFDPCRALDWQVLRPFAVQNPGGVLAHHTISLSDAASITHETSIVDSLAPAKDRRDAIMAC